MATSTFEVHRIELAAQPADFTGKMREAAGFTVFTEMITPPPRNLGSTWASAVRVQQRRLPCVRGSRQTRLVAAEAHCCLNNFQIKGRDGV